MHTVHLNTFVKLNKTLGAHNLSTKRKGVCPLYIGIYFGRTQRESINSQQLHGPIDGASTTNHPPLRPKVKFLVNDIS